MRQVLFRINNIKKIVFEIPSLIEILVFFFKILSPLTTLLFWPSLRNEYLYRRYPKYSMGLGCNKFNKLFLLKIFFPCYFSKFCGLSLGCHFWSSF
jgi:hypothetical protein